jgi:hypothetical protein
MNLKACSSLKSVSMKVLKKKKKAKVLVGGRKRQGQSSSNFKPSITPTRPETDTE